ncbi:MAG: hypothetical protein LIR46_02930 [Bacteroidota bacterium]|nr:hypothetical protein [Bacteroidota bacterium]
MDRNKVITELEMLADRTNDYTCEGLKCCKIAEDVLSLLKEQEVRQLTIDEWREWKNNPKRNPICKLWKYDTSPIWVLNPDSINEPALLMGKLKLFTGKPTFEQCKAVKWNG